ncbi:hypothetical protein ACK3TF_006106 [Chlorella vulgaris]
MNAGHERQDLLPTHGPLSAAPGGSTVGLVEGRRSGDCLLYVCRMVNVLTAMCALLCALAFGMAWWVRGDAPAKDPYFYSGQAVRVFGIGLALLIVLVEAEWHVFAAYMPLLDSWLGRGIFVATLTFREAYPSGTTDFHKSLALYRSAASLSLLVCGTVYILGAVTCIGFIKNAKQRQEQHLLRAAAELDRMERRKKDLERQLGRQPLARP